MTATRSVLFALTDTHHGFFKGAARYAREHRWHVVADMIYTAKIPVGWRGDGILSFIGYRDDLAEFILSSGLPAVEISMVRNDINLPRVEGDSEMIGRLAANHLLERGYGHYAWSPLIDDVLNAERYRGYANRLAMEGFRARRQLVWTAKATWSSRRTWTATSPQTAASRPRASSNTALATTSPVCNSRVSPATGRRSGSQVRVSARSVTTHVTAAKSTSWKSRGWTRGGSSTPSTGTATARTTSPRADVAKVPGVMNGFHTFGLWWKPDEYIFYVDGKETWRSKAGGVCQVPEYMLLSDEIGNWAGDIAKAKLPDQFLVDYVRVYDLVETK